MPDEGISTKVSVLGDKEYKAALADLSRQLTLLNTDMKATQSAFSDQESSVDALKAKSESLQSVYDTQAKKVQLIAEQLNKAKEEYGENSKQADNLQIALNRAQTALNKVGTELDDTNAKLEKAEQAQESAAKGYDTIGEGAKAADEKIALLTSQLEASQSAFGNQADTLAGLKDKYDGLTGVYDAHKEKVAALTNDLELAKAAYGENSKEVNDLQTALNKAETAMNDVGTEVGETESAIDKMTDAVSKSSDENDGMTLTLRDVEKAEKDEAKEAESAAKETKSFGESLGEAAKTAASFTLEAVAAAYAAVTAAASAAGAAVVDSLKVYADYDDGLKQVQATMGLVAGVSAETDAAIQLLDQAAKDAGANTKFTARDAADALNYLALAGYDAERATEALPGVLNLAAAGGMDLAKASDMVTDAMSALQLTDMDSFLDSLAKTSQKSNTNVEQLGEGVLKLGATGRTVKGGIDEINLMLGLMADNGIKGAEGGTHLRNMILSLITPTDTAAKAIQKLGLEVFDAEGNMRAMPDILQDLSGKLDGLSDEEKMNIISTIFNKTDIASVNALLGTSAERWEELADEIANSEGACAQMAETMESGLGGSIRSFQSAAEGLQIAVGSIFSEMAQGMVNDTTTMMRDITGILSDGFQPEDVQAIADVLTTFIDEQLTNIIGLVGDAMPLLTEALSTIVGVLVEQLPGLSEKILPAAFSLLQSVINAVVENVEPLTGLAVSLITSLVSFLLENVGSLLEAAIGIVTGLVSGITEKLPELIPLAVEMMVQLALALVGAIPELVTCLPDIVNAIIEGLKNVDWAQLGLDMITGLYNGLKAAVETLIESIKSVITSIWDAIKGVFGINSPSTVAAEAGGFILSGLVNGFLEAVESVIKQVKEIFGRIWDAIKTIFGFGKGESDESKEAKQAGKDIMTGMQKGIEDNEEKVKNTVKNVSKMVLDTFKTELGIEGNTSSKTKPYGEAVAVGVDDGLYNKSQASTFQKGANAAANAAGDAMNSAFGIAGTGLLGMGEQQASKFVYIGEAVAAGIAKGIENGAGKITAAATQAANAAYQAACQALGVASPAKRMIEVGQFFDEGFAIGIDKGMDGVLRNARSLANMAASEAQAGGTFGAGSVRDKGIDYGKLGDAVANSFIKKGIDRTAIYMDKRKVGETVEPSVSRETHRRSKQSVTGRAARMVLV